MNLHLIYFSPGGTTKKTVRNISKGFSNIKTKEYDMLKKNVREQNYSFGSDDIVILGFMTATKLFGLVEDVLNSLKGNNTPLIGVVLFGNGYYGSSLKTLKIEVEERGFKLVGAGAFIGQHTFTSSIATNRPDEKDKQIQEQFGLDMYNKICINKDLSFTHVLKKDWARNDWISYVKGHIADKLLSGISCTLPSSWSNLEFTDTCVDCGKCERNCPTSSIVLKDKYFNPDSCIGCFSCGNNCPEDAIIYKSKKLLSSIKHIEKTRIKRREPQIFF